MKSLNDLKKYGWKKVHLDRGEIERFSENLEKYVQISKELRLKSMRSHHQSKFYVLD